MVTRPPTAPPAHGAGNAGSPAPGGSSKMAIAIGAAVFLVLAVWTGARVHEALEKRAASQAATTEAEDASAAPPEAPSVVRGAPVSHRPAVALEGTLVASREVDLAFKASGQLAGVRVALGQLVRQGEVIATLDSKESAAQVRAAEAQVRAAEAQLALAEDAQRRTSDMVGSGTLPEATGVQTEQQRALALAQLDGARAQLSLARAALANHTLVAPFAGFVTRVPPGTGAVMAAGVPAFHLSDVTTLTLKGTVGEQEAELLREGGEIEIDAQGRKVTGKIVAVLTSVDPVTRRVPFEAAVANDVEPKLLAGALVRAVVRAKEPLDVLRLPRAALRPGSQSEIVVVSEGKLRTRRVVLAASEAGELLIRSGLAPDEDVLAAPPPNVTDGMDFASLPGAAK